MFGKVLAIFAFSLVLSLIVIVSFFVSVSDIVKSDFPSFLTGAELVKRGDGNFLYNLKTQEVIQNELVGNVRKDIFLPYRNLPFVAIFFIPLSFLPLILAYKIFALANIFCLVALAWLFWDFLGKKVGLAVLLIVSLTFLANLNAIFYGQISIFLILVLFICYRFIRDKRDFFAGIMFAFFLIKPQYLVLMPFIFLVANKKLAFLKGFLMTTLSFLLLSLLIAGTHFPWEYIQFILLTESLAYGTNVFEMYSLPSAVNYFAGRNLPPGWFLVLLIPYLILIWIFYKGVKKRVLEENLTIACITSVVFAPHIFAHGLTLLTVPLYILLRDLRKKTGKKRKFSVILFFLIFLIPLTSFFRSGNLVLLNSLLLFVCLWMAFKLNLKSSNV